MERCMSQDDIFLAECLLDKVAYFNTFMPYIDRNIEKSRKYQDNFLLTCDNKHPTVARTARAVGKSSLLVSDVSNIMITNPGSIGLITTPMKAHIDPLFNKLIAFFNANKFVKDFVKPNNGGRVIRSPEYMIELTNKFCLYGRISGSNKGVSLYGLHVFHIWIDESGIYMRDAVENLEGCKNPGCEIKAFGVPTGLRNSYLSMLWSDKAIPDYKKFKIPRTEDPSFTEKMKQEALSRLGGANSPAYRNQVMAEDDVVQKTTFNAIYYEKCLLDYDDYVSIELDGTKCDQNEISVDNDFMFANYDEYKKLIISEDVGYDPDPSVIGIWGESGNTTKLLFKIILRSISFSVQAKLLHGIALKIGAMYVSLDVGGVGRSIYLDLTNNTLFPDKPYEVVEVNFGSNVEFTLEDGVDIKEPIKEFSTNLLSDLFQKRNIILPRSDSDIYNEIFSSTVCRTASGRYTYNGIDHHLDMIRACVITRIIKRDDYDSKDKGSKDVNDSNEKSTVATMADF